MILQHVYPGEWNIITSLQICRTERLLSGITNCSFEVREYTFLSFSAPNTDGFTCGGNGSYNASEGPIFPILPTNYTPNVTIDFEEQMTQYALYYVYIASGVLVSSYLQVNTLS